MAKKLDDMPTESNVSAVIEGNIELIRDCEEKLTNINAKAKKDRAKVNADKNKARKEILGLGITPQALDLTLRFLELNDEDKAECDKGLVMIRRAVGQPMQSDLFE